MASYTRWDECTEMGRSEPVAVVADVLHFCDNIHKYSGSPAMTISTSSEASALDTKCIKQCKVPPEKTTLPL